MDFSKIPLFSALTKRMAWLGERQKVLAQNIANSDTPNYMPKDLKQIDFLGMAESASRGVTMSVTNVRHLVGSNPAPPKFDVADQKDVYEITPAGNAVVLEEQLMKVSETVMDYQVMANLYRKHVGMIKTALGRSN
jgi:flagellar basal-body rod protein FlgB